MSARDELVPVFEWLLNGRAAGLGTKVEFDYHTPGLGAYTLGGIIGYEPANLDEERKALWKARDY